MRGVERRVVASRRSTDDRQPRLVRLLQEVTRAANEADRVTHARQRALAAVCEATGWPVGHLWVPAGSDPDAFVSSGVWHTAPAGPTAAGSA